MGTKIKYRIRFSQEPLSPEELLSFKSMPDIKVRGDIEKRIVRAIVNQYGAKTAKNIEEFSMAAELISALKHAGEDIVIDTEDREMITKGFEESIKMAGMDGRPGRPDGWSEYPELFRQLRNPETVEEK
jgi:hypothetical protein